MVRLPITTLVVLDSYHVSIAPPNQVREQTHPTHIQKHVDQLRQSHPPEPQLKPSVKAPSPSRLGTRTYTLQDWVPGHTPFKIGYQDIPPSRLGTRTYPLQDWVPGHTPFKIGYQDIPPSRLGTRTYPLQDWVPGHTPFKIGYQDIPPSRSGTRTYPLQDWVPGHTPFLMCVIPHTLASVFKVCLILDSTKADQSIKMQEQPRW